MAGDPRTRLARVNTTWLHPMMVTGQRRCTTHRLQKEAMRMQEYNRGRIKSTWYAGAVGVVLPLTAANCLGRFRVFKPNEAERCIVGGTVTIHWSGGQQPQRQSDDDGLQHRDSIESLVLAFLERAR